MRALRLLLATAFTVAGSLGLSVLTESTTAAVIVGTVSMSCLSPANCARISAEESGEPEAGLVGA
jgi:hypothetical protein